MTQLNYFTGGLKFSIGLDGKAEFQIGGEDWRILTEIGRLNAVLIPYVGPVLNDLVPHVGDIKIGIEVITANVVPSVAIGREGHIDLDPMTRAIEVAISFIDVRSHADCAQSNGFRRSVQPVNRMDGCRPVKKRPVRQSAEIADRIVLAVFYTAQRVKLPAFAEISI